MSVTLFLHASHDPAEIVGFTPATIGANGYAVVLRGSRPTGVGLDLTGAPDPVKVVADFLGADAYAHNGD